MAFTSLPPSADFARMIQGALNSEVEKVIEAEVEKAKASVEAAVRGKVGEISAKILERFSMERIGQDLNIKVEAYFKP